MAVTPVRARDLRANITEHGFEKGMMLTLEAMLEEHSAFRVNQRDMAQLLHQCIEQTTSMVHVGDKMALQMNELYRKLSPPQED